MRNFQNFPEIFLVMSIYKRMFILHDFILVNNIISFCFELYPSYLLCA